MVNGFELVAFGMFMMQIIELPDHPYYIGVQFHPEFKSRPGKPSALFLGTLIRNPFFFFGLKNMVKKRFVLEAITFF